MATTPLGQICKLNLLIEHYQKHNKENKELSFIGFLKLHYFNGDPKDDDYEEDMKLPFKSIDFNNNISTYIAFEFPSYKIEKPTYTALTVQKFSKSDSWHSNIYLDAIWHPPRVA